MAELHTDESGDYILSADITLNVYYYDPSPANERQCVVAHEFGHVLGLGHAAWWVQALMNTMAWDWWGIYTPQQDDINGVNAIYGAP